MSVATVPAPIQAGASQSLPFVRKGLVKGAMIFIPAGVEGVIGFLASPDGVTWSEALDYLGNRIQIDPSALPVTPAEMELHPALYGAHQVKIITWVDATAAAEQAQTEKRAFRFMGQG